MENRTEEPGVLTPPVNTKAPEGPSIDKTPEQIERDMQDTRDSMTAKVAALENQVVGTVQTAANTISDTVDSMRSLVNSAPDAVSDTMKQAATAVSDTFKKAFDITGQVERHPWTAVGISAGLGFLTAMLCFRNNTVAAAATPVAPVAPQYLGTPPSEVKSEPGLFDNLMEMVGKKVKALAETAIESASAAVTEQVREGIPKLVENATESVGLPVRNGARQYA